MKQYFSIDDIGYKMGTQVLKSQEIGKQFATDEESEKKISHFVEDILGKEIIHKFSDTDCICDMCGEIGRQVLSSNFIDPKEVDMLICTSVVPEYYLPATSIKMHKQLGLRSDVKVAVDMNANCVGMVAALYYINAVMAVDREVNTVLILDAMTVSDYIPAHDLAGRASFSDAVAAVLVKRRSEPVDGFYFQSFQDSSQSDALVGPNWGMFKSYKSGSSDYFGIIDICSIDCKMDMLLSRVKDFMLKADISPCDIKHYCCSQHVKANINFLRDGLGLNDDVIPYVGRDLGYTGPSSPLLALDKHVQEGKLVRGEKVFFWTIATGIQHVMMLMTY